MPGAIHNKAVRCPACGYLCDVASGLNTDGRPEPGDASLCLNCGLVMIFTVFGARAADPAELDEVLAELGVLQAIDHIRQRGFIPGYRR